MNLFEHHFHNITGKYGFGHYFGIKQPEILRSQRTCSYKDNIEFCHMTQKHFCSLFACIQHLLYLCSFLSIIHKSCLTEVMAVLGKHNKNTLVWFPAHTMTRASNQTKYTAGGVAVGDIGRN